MNDNGFTLIELLAVIAILAILVIIALPNVIGLYNSAKQESFLTEVKSLASTAEKQYMSNQLSGRHIRKFSSSGNKLEMSGKELQYCIILNTDGKIIKLEVSNGSWIASLNDDEDVTNLTIDNLENGNLDNNQCAVIATKSFSEDSWDTIVSAVIEGDIDNYNIGDTKEVELGSTYGTHTLRIANMSTPEECKIEGFSQTACGFVLEFVDIIVNYKMNDTNTNIGGWSESEMRTYVNNDIYNALPTELQNGIINTTVVSSYGSDDSNNFTSTDKLYLLSPKEIYSDWSKNTDTSNDFTRQLDYYKEIGTSTSTSNNYNKAKKTYNGITSWWMRSAYHESNACFFGIANNGYYGSCWSASGVNGVSPAFRIG